MGRNLADCVALANGVPQTAAHRLNLICTALAYLRKNARAVFGDSRLRDQVPDLLDDANKVNNQLKDWAQWVPPEWKWTTAERFEIPESLSRRDFVYDNSVDVYLDLHVAQIWNFYRATRIKVLIIALECHNTVSEASLGRLAIEKQEVVEDLQSLVDDICGTIPFNLGTRTIPGYTDYPDVEYPYTKTKASREHRHSAAASGGWALIEPYSEPLPVAIEVPCTRPGQREWLMTQLSRISELYNVVPLVAMMKQKIRRNSNPLLIGNATIPQQASCRDIDICCDGFPANFS